MVKNAFFLSYWESGAMFRAPCQVDTKTHLVFGIMNVGHPGEDDELRYETIEVDNDGLEENVVNIDEVLELEERKDALLQLSSIKQTHRYWYSPAGNTLNEVLAWLQK